eukprot:gnl/MRDRNA2_/MRDRNA2_337328_c0_seq1.p1 gnl/MRDRNA2_/MRDRNA2_337328_c0~~gnl/MRDRNA2_/MRDRNA2_337328_c0_seq1.p1  ORF type:complete len:132 (-),score=10.70 gnl/MRDRNA2_/MRDRNA2_337328_c0_seq1:40-435(-)
MGDDLGDITNGIVSFFDGAGLCCALTFFSIMSSLLLPGVLLSKESAIGRGASSLAETTATVRKPDASTADAKNLINVALHSPLSNSWMLIKRHAVDCKIHIKDYAYDEWRCAKDCQSLDYLHSCNSYISII